MAAPADNPKYAVHLVEADDGNDQNSLDSLVGDGPLRLSTLHVLAKALPQRIVKVDGDADGRHEATMHLLEFLFVPHAALTRALKSKPVLWAVKTSRLARWFHSLDKAGVDWSPCSIHQRPHPSPHLRWISRDDA